jgi:predicted pyridoxine 5'-phosphate oxidase superfamily flavin-nucleotide-binding protein
VHNQNVCVSFIDILVQKGFQLKGLAEIIKKNNSKFPEMEKALLKMTGGIFSFTAIIAVTIEQAKEIIAPRYMLFPNTTEEEQIENAKKMYGL